jgi:hypothetical protein
MNNMHGQGSSGSSPSAHHARMIAAARILLGLGYKLVPTAGKDPYEMGWQTNNYTLEILEQRIRAGNNLGVLFGQDLGDGTAMVMFDADLDVPAASFAVRPKLGDAASRTGRWPKFAIPIRVPFAEAFNRNFNFYSGPDLGARRIGVQILGRAARAPHNSSQAVVAGIHPDTGQLYTWEPDSKGNDIFSIPPQGWKLVPSLEELMLDVSATLAGLGWTHRVRQANHIEGEDFTGDITEDMIEDARGLFERRLAQVASQPPGTGRGSEVHNLGLQIGMMIKRGILDFDQCKRSIAAAMPDDATHASEHEFPNGVNKSRGDRQRNIHEKQNPNWQAEAEKQGVKLGTGPTAAGAGGAGGSGGGGNTGGPGAGAGGPSYSAIIWMELVNGVLDYILTVVNSKKTEMVKRQMVFDAASFADSLICVGAIDVKTLAAMWDAMAATLTARLQPKGLQVGQILAMLPSMAGVDMANYAADLVMRGESGGQAVRLALFKFKGAAAAQTAFVEGVEVDLINVEELNDRYARFCAPGLPPAWVDRNGGKLLDIKALAVATAGEFIAYVDPVTGDETFRRAHEAWRDWRGIHTYRDIVFTNKPVEDDVLNLFHGFGIDPKAGDCSLILQHIKEVLCNGDETAFERMLDLEAWQVQHVGEASRVIRVVFTGKHQTGKGIYFEQVVLKIWGQAGANEANDEAFAGRFNDTLRGKGFILLDEAAFAGNQKMADAIKRASTAKRMNLEPKFGSKFESPMGVNLVILSNMEHAAHIEEGDARHWVIKPNEIRAGDYEYFKALGAQVENGGPAAFLDMLLKRDVSQFNPQRDCPMNNEARRDMEVLSRRPGHIRTWLAEVAITGSFGIFEDLKFGEEANTQQLHMAYSMWHRNERGRYVEPKVPMQGFKLSKFGFMRSTGRGKRDEAGIQRMPPWLIPAREELAKFLGVELEDVAKNGGKQEKSGDAFSNAFGGKPFI